MSATADALMGIFGFKRVESEMKTDRELLELAAKAAGYVITGWNNRNSTTVAVLSDGSYWQPLLKNQITDTDGEALRLAVKLSLRVECYTGVKIHPKYGESHVTDVYSIHNDNVALSESHNGDPCAATRRAIVRAAAAIGESMRD